MSLSVKNERDVFLQGQDPRINQEGLPPEMVIPGLKQVLLRGSENHFRVKYGGDPEGTGVIQIEATLINIIGTPVFTAIGEQGTVPLQSTADNRIKLLNFEDMDGDRVEIHVEVEDQSLLNRNPMVLPTIYRNEINIVKVYDRHPMPVEDVITDFSLEGRVDSVIVKVNAISTVDRVVELWRALGNQSLAQAVKVREFEGTQYEDLNLSLFQPYRYWVRLKDTQYGFAGAFVGPREVTTGQIQKTLDALAGKITRTQLHQDLTTELDQVEEVVGNAANAIQQLTEQVDEDLGAFAQALTQVSTTVDGYSATIQQQSESIDGLSAQYTVRIDNNGRVAGYGLASGEDGTSDFIVVTDRFSIFDAVDPTKMVLGTENGVTIIKGAYIDTIVASQIDSRGLTIKDAEGNVIFGAGTGLSWSQITGATKPADGATRNVFRGAWATSLGVISLGDIVTDGGNGWACIQAHTAASGNRPPSSGNSNAWWSLHASKGDTGPAGSTGLSVAEVMIYRRATSAPATPTGGSFNFGTQALTAPSGWSTSVPSGTNPVYVSVALASSATPTGSATISGWSAPSLAFQNGATGADGLNSVNLTLYQSTNPGEAVDRVDFDSSWSLEDRILSIPSSASVQEFDTPSGGYHAGGYGLRFTTAEKCLILSAVVQPAFTGNASAVLYDFDSGEILQEVSFNTLANTPQTIFLGFHLEPGVNYWLTPIGGSFLRSEAGVEFPITSGPLEFTIGTTSTGVSAARWYYFFNLNYKVTPWCLRLPNNSEKLIWVSTTTLNTSTLNAEVSSGMWTLPSVLSSKGADGLHGQSVDMIFQRTTGTPTTPSASTGVPTGWFTSVNNVPAGAGYVWSSVGTRAGGASNWTWQTPIRVEGTQGVDGTSGADALTVIVQNEAHVMPASSAGVVSSYSGSGTTIQVFEGLTALAASSTLANGRFTIGTPTISPASSVTVGARSYSGTTATVANHSAMSNSQDTVVITYPINIRRSNGTNVTISKTQTLTKSKAGATGNTGPQGPALVLTPTGQAFTYLDGTANPASQSLSFTATLHNLTGSVVWSTSPSVTLTGSGNTRSLSIANFGANQQVRVTATVGGVSDSVTVVRLQGSTAEAGATVGASFGNVNVISSTTPVYLEQFESNAPKMNLNPNVVFSGPANNPPTGWEGGTLLVGDVGMRQANYQTLQSDQVFLGNVCRFTLTQDTSTPTGLWAQILEEGSRPVVPGGWEPGETYVISFKARAVEITNPAGYTMIGTVVSNYQSNSLTDVQNPELTHEFQQYVFSVVVEPTLYAGFGQVFVGVKSGSMIHSGDSFEIAKVKIERRLTPALPGEWENYGPSFTEIGTDENDGFGTYLRSYGYTWLYGPQVVPYNPEKLYRIRVLARSASVMPGIASIGVIGVGANGIVNVGRDGVYGFSSFFVARNNKGLTGEFQEYIGYFTGASETPPDSVGETFESPVPLHSDVHFIKPVIVPAMLQAPSVIVDIGYVIIEEVELLETVGNIVGRINAANADVYLGDSVIKSAMIAEVIQSTNYSAGASPSGWRIAKSGQIFCNDLYARGVIEGSLIKGSVIDGSLFIGATEMTMPTEADTGSGTRYLGFATSGWSGSASGSGIRTVTSSLRSANFTGEGTVAYEGMTTYKNFNRYLKYVITPAINLSSTGVTRTTSFQPMGNGTWHCRVRIWLRSGGTVIGSFDQTFSATRLDHTVRNFSVLGGVFRLTRYMSSSPNSFGGTTTTCRYDLTTISVVRCPGNYTGNGVLSVESSVTWSMSIGSQTADNVTMSVSDQNERYL